MRVDKTLDRPDDWLDVLVHSDTLDYSPRKPKYAAGTNIVRRIPDVILYSVKIWRSSKSRDFHRRTRRKGAQHTLPAASHQFHVRRVAIFPLLHDSPRFPLKITRRDRKARPAVRRGTSTDTIEGRILLLRLILDFLYTAMPWFRWIFLGRIHNVHLYARVSNSYPDRFAGTIEPMNVYPMTLPRILTGELPSKACRWSSSTFLFSCYISLLYVLLQKNLIQLLLYK